jgi:hypothetical protein
MRKILFGLFVLFSIALDVNGQELTGGAALYSRYIWRGLDLGGQSANIQPWAKLSLGNDNHSFALGALSAYSISPAVNDEVDLWASYTYKKAISCMITDYFFSGLNSGAKDHYFEYGKDSTGHVYEGVLSFNGTEKIPFTLLFSINFYGNDARKSNGDIFMSKYVEAGYKKNIKGVDFSLFAGFALDKINKQKGETGYYLNENPNLINLGLKLDKTVFLTEKFSLPLQFAFITNPELKKTYMTFGLFINMQ